MPTGGPGHPAPAATLTIDAHLSGEAASVGRAREHVNEQFAGLTSGDGSDYSEG